MTSTPKRRDSRRFRLAGNDNETIVETTPKLETGKDDVEGHRKGPGGNIPNVDGSPDDFNNKRLFRDFDAGKDDVEGHRKGPGGNIPNVDGSPDDFNNKRLFRDFDAGSD